MCAVSRPLWAVENDIIYVIVHKVIYALARNGSARKTQVNGRAYRANTRRTGYNMYVQYTYKYDILMGAVGGLPFVNKY